MSQDKSLSQNPEKPRQSITDKIKNILLTEIPTPNLNMPDLMTHIIPGQKSNSIKTEKAEYTQLRDFLAEKNWKQADQETWRLICLVAGREKEGWLKRDSLINFPCQDLLIVNKLWTEFSQGHFGFSVQKEIYHRLGGQNKFDEKIWKALGNRVGWRNNDNWLNYFDLQFDLQALKGHLPFEPMKVNLGANPSNIMKRGTISCQIFSHLETCQKELVK